MLRTLLTYTRDYFGFSKIETSGILLLFPVLLVSVVLPFLMTTCSRSGPELATDHAGLLAWKEESERLITTVPAPTKGADLPKVAEKRKRETAKPKKSFAFNPNTVTKSELLSLGFSERTAKNWLSFVGSGMKIYNIEHLFKIYNIEKDRVNELRAYIQYDLAPKNSSAKARETNKYVSETQHIKETNLNATTAEDLMLIRGIGVKLSQRIIKYRNRLGGFYAPAQLHEVYGLSPALADTVISRFTISRPERVIAVNVLDVKALVAHPYIEYPLARSIVNYREQHGAYQGVQDLRRIHLADSATVSRLSPYLDFRKP